MSKPFIFISYSHKDEKWKDRLVSQLAVLEMEGSFDVWTDREIGTGEIWYEKIEEAMQKASLVILLVSANSLTSEFILKKEMADLLKRRDEEGLRILPVIIRDCPWKHVKWLARMQVRPRDGRALQQMTSAQQEAELSSIVSEVAGVFASPPESPTGE